MRAADAFTESRAEVGVAHRRLYLPVAEQLADHGQAFSERKGAGRERVSEIVAAEAPARDREDQREAPSVGRRAPPPVRCRCLISGRLNDKIHRTGGLL